MFIQFACAFGGTLGPTVLTIYLEGNADTMATRPLVANIFMFTSAFNFFTALVSLTLSAALAGVLIHRLFWPITSRLIYPAVRYKVIGNRKFLWTAGIACFVYSFQLTDVVGKTFLGLIPK